MQHVLSSPLVSHQASFLRTMAGSTAVMALSAGGGALAGYFWFGLSWLMASGIAFLAIVFYYAARNEEDDDALNTFWATFGAASCIGFVVGQLALSIAAPIVISMTAWSVILVAVMSVVGMFVPKVFTEKGGLLTLVGGSLFLAFALEQTAFLYLASTEADPYHMAPLAWIGVAVFAALTAVCWHRALDWLPSTDNAIRAAGGPVMNVMECGRALVQVLDRLSDRAPWSSDEDEDNK